MATNPTDRSLALSDTAIVEFLDLVQANLDSYNVLTEASDRMNDPVLAEILAAIALRRARNAEDLKRHLRVNDEVAGTSGTLTGLLHQVWVDCRAAINAGDSYVMLIEAEKAEDAIQRAYGNAVRHLGDSATLAHVLEQYRVIGRDAKEIADLRRNFKAVRRGMAAPEDHP